MCLIAMIENLTYLVYVWSFTDKYIPLQLTFFLFVVVVHVANYADSKTPFYVEIYYHVSIISDGFLERCKNCPI